MLKILSVNNESVFNSFFNLHLSKMKHYKLYLALLAAIILIACNKEKFTTKPQLKFKGVNLTSVAAGQRLSFDLEVTDAEGDISDTFFMRREVRRFPSLSQTDSFPIPIGFEITKDFIANLNICFLNNRINQGCPSITARSSQSQDTTTFKFWLRDKAKNYSDTLTVPEVIVIKK
jgi:hypothetical protein